MAHGSWKTVPDWAVRDPADGSIDVWVQPTRANCCFLPLLSKPSKLPPSVLIILGQQEPLEPTGASGTEERADDHGGCLWNGMAKPSHGFLAAGTSVSVGAPRRATKNIGLWESVMPVSLVTC